MLFNIIGIDLAAKSENETGIAIINGKKVILKTVFSNKDIIQTIKKISPSMVAIDAPLSLPKGRCCLEKDCKCRVGGHFRQSDLQMRKYGGVLPLTFPGMKTLTFRGIGLKKLINEVNNNLIGNNSITNKLITDDFEKDNDLILIETHPRTSQRIFGFLDNLDEFFTIIEEFFEFNKCLNDATQHEIDGLFAALSGLFYSCGKYLEVGDSEEGMIVVPQVNTNFKKDLSEILEVSENNNRIK